jgi:hypothetical protein
VLSILMAAGLAQASPLNLFERPPDIYSDYIQVSYTSASHSFSALGQAFTFDIDGLPPPDYDIVDAGDNPGGLFDIEAKIDNSGNPISGTLTVDGYIPDLLGSHGTGTLLTGTLSRFGFPNAGGDPLEFIFTTTGGDLSSYLPQADVILNYSGYDGTFHQDFSNYGMGEADAFVPEPATLTCLSFGATFLIGFARKRARQGRKS